MTAAAANAITVDEIISLVYSLKSPYRKNAKFLMNDATIPLLRKLKDAGKVDKTIEGKKARFALA